MYVGHFDFTAPMLQVIEGLYARAECNAVTRGTKHVLRSDVLYVPA
jgi:hypothetical protein